ncbi:MAG: hypothetical protein R3C11_22155 [Planctomycetaceae bacterium]
MTTKGNEFNLDKVIDSVVAVMKMDGEKITSQEYLEYQITQQISSDGQIVKQQDNGGPVESFSAEGLHYDCASPHTLLFLNRFIHRPLSEILAGKSPEEIYVKISHNKWNSSCEITGEEMVDDEPVVVVKCESRIPESSFQQDWTEYFYLAKTRTTFPSKLFLSEQVIWLGEC